MPWIYFKAVAEFLYPLCSEPSFQYNHICRQGQYLSFKQWIYLSGYIRTGVAVETNDTFAGIVWIIMIWTGTVLDTVRPKDDAAVERSHVLMLLLLIHLQYVYRDCFRLGLPQNSSPPWGGKNWMIHLVWYYISTIKFSLSWERKLWCFRLLYGTTKLWWSQKWRSYDVSDSCMVL